MFFLPPQTSCEIQIQLINQMTQQIFIELMRDDMKVPFKLKALFDYKHYQNNIEWVH